MATFVCCADESTDGRQATDFFYGGFAASAETWEGDFTPAWRERVLKEPPPLDYLHMSSIVRRDWRGERGISRWDADRRVEEASRVIGSCGGLVPIVCHLSQSRFKGEVLPYAPINRHSALEEPDYISFLAFTYTTLLWLHQYRPEAEKVDFWVEQNGKISTRIGRLHARTVENLLELERPELASPVGAFVPVTKECIPAQAADFLCWHERNAKNETLDRAGWRRRNRLTHEREGCRTDVDDALIDDLAASLRQTFPRIR